MKVCPQCSEELADTPRYCPGCGFPVGAIEFETSDDFIGQTLPGGFQILELIGIGAMGRVYRAEQRVLGRTVAVKLIHPQLLADDRQMARFLTEARAASKLNHPNSVSVIDFGNTEQGVPYLVMEYLSGQDLKKLLSQAGPLPITRICKILEQILSALGQAHDLEIVHRDLKPENIVIESVRRGGDFVKVVDFGLAKLALHEDPGVTSPGFVCGTPDYMAPEQSQGLEVDGRADLYAAGVILFQMLSGRVPYPASNPASVVQRHISDPIPDVRQVAPDRAISDELSALTTRALAKDPADRYQNAHDFIDALEEAVSTGTRAGRQWLAKLVDCPECASRVPSARYCCDCGERLPTTSNRPASAMYLPKLPLISRAADLKWLDEQRTSAMDRVVTLRVVGEPGIGKSRLLTAFAAQQRELGNPVIEVRGLPNGGSAPGSGLEAMLRQRAIRVPAPSLTSLLSTQLTADAKRAQLRSALASTLAVDYPTSSVLVVLVDDLENLDGVSRNAISDWLDLALLSLRQVLLVVTHRPGFEPGWEADELRVLQGVSAPGLSREMPHDDPIQAVLGEFGATAEENPLALLQRYALHRDGATVSYGQMANVVAGRMNLLAPIKRLVLQSLAIWSLRASGSTLLALGGSVLEDSNQLESLLTDLGETGWIERDEDGVCLVHPFIGEIIRASTPAAVRKDLHDAARRECERLDLPLTLRAFHAFESEDSFVALILAEQVAQQAHEMGDHDTAITYLRRALELARSELHRGELSDPLAAVGMFGRKLGAVLLDCQRVAAARGVLHEALDTTGPNSVERALVLEVLAKAERAEANHERASTYLEQALRCAEQSGDQTLQARLTREIQHWNAQHAS